MRQPQIGDRVAELRPERGRRCFEVFGTVRDCGQVDDVGKWCVLVDFSARRKNGEFEAFEHARVIDASEVIGEWEGHCEDGDTCWCVPTIERGETGDIIIHNDEKDAS